MIDTSSLDGLKIGPHVLEWYRQHIGEPPRESVVYSGFALFFGGIALVLVGILVFLWSAGVGGDPGFVLTLREVAGTSAATGLPLVLLGVTVLLPVDRRAMYASVFGTVVCLAAVVLFVDAYPHNWIVRAGMTDVAGNMIGQVVGVYAVGIAAVIGGTGAALVGHHLQQARASGPGAAVETDSDDTEDYSDERIRRDIDEAMAATELTWGGVAKTETKRLKLNTGVSEDIDRRNLDSASAKTTRSSGTNVDAAVSGLQKIQGRDKKTTSGQGTDDQAAALNELRKQQQRKAEQEAESRTLFARLRSWLS